MKGYSDAAVAKMLEAEAILSRGLELREEAKAMFARANELALEYAAAVIKARDVAPVEEDIDW